MLLAMQQGGRCAKMACHLHPEPSPLASALMAMNMLLGPEEAPSLSIFSVIDRPPMWVLSGLSYGYEVAVEGKGKMIRA